MDYLISVSFGELTLKGDNRKDFENYLSFNFFPLWEKCKIKGYPEKYNPK